MTEAGESFVLPATEPLSVRGIVGSAFRLVSRNRREAMLPLAAVQVPVSIATAVATAVLYLTVFRDDPVQATDKLIEDGGGPLLAFIILTAIEGLFAQVARAATVVSIAGVALAKPKSLSAALDPAFTRMGGLLVLVAVVAAGAGLALISVVGLIFLPYIALRLALSVETYMLEGLGPTAALRRSWELMRGNVLRFLGVILLAFLVLLGPLASLSILGAFVGGGRTARVIEIAFLTVAQGILVIPLIAFLTATTTLYYLTIKARRDAQASPRI